MYLILNIRLESVNLMRVDDAAAREEWGWTPEYDMASMTADMIAEISGRFVSEPD